MAITLGAYTLPAGLVWSDETSWSPVVQSSENTLTGAIVIEEWSRVAGRPITLVGGRDGNTSWAWMTRAAALALKAALDAAGVVMILTLHDGRTFRVTARRDDGSPVQITPLPIVAERAPAAPKDASVYVVERINLMEIPA